MDEFMRLIRRSARRLRLRDSWWLAQNSLWVAAALSAIILALGRIIPIEYLVLWSIIPMLIWLLVLIAVPLFRTPNVLSLARRIDDELNLKQRLSTAIALAEDRTGFNDRFSESLVTAQQQDALNHLRQIDPRRDFPLRWQKRTGLLAAVFLFCVLILAILPNPMDVLIATRHQIAQASAHQAEKIEELRQEIESAEELSPEIQEELLRQLAELAKTLRANPGDLEESLAEISRLKTALQKNLDPSAATQAAALNALAAQLSALNGQEPGAEEEALQAAEQALEDLAGGVNNLSSMERAQLSESIAQMAASASQAGNFQLAQALSALSQAVAAGDPETASQSAMASQAAMVQAMQSLYDQNAIEAVLSQLNASSQALAQAGRPNDGQSTANNPGQNLASLPGNSQGQPSGQISGGGTQADSLPPAAGQGRPGAPQGSSQTPGDPVPQEKVYAPRQSGTGQGDSLIIPGVDSGQGETMVTEGDSTLPGAANPALVPYDQVYYEYLQAANQAINQITIPASLQAYVREYFSQLEP